VYSKLLESSGHDQDVGL